MMQEITLTNEQEAAVAMLFAAVMAGDKPMNQSQIEQISRMLVLSSRFDTAELNGLSRKALALQNAHGSKAVIETAAPLIGDEFRETLFAMCCEIITYDGRVDDPETEVLAMVALHLKLSVETMRMMLTTYLIRNRWNVQIIEPE